MATFCLVPLSPGRVPGSSQTPRPETTAVPPGTRRSGLSTGHSPTSAPLCSSSDDPHLLQLEAILFNSQEPRLGPVTLPCDGHGGNMPPHVCANHRTYSTKSDPNERGL